MLPPEFLESAGYLYKAFKIVSGIMKSVYNETEVDKNVVMDIKKLKKVIIRRSRSSISIRKVETRHKKHANHRKRDDLKSFLKKNIKRYRKKYYDLPYKDVFTILMKKWKEIEKKEL